ncbi:hypothetical protein [Paenibacillus bouchesdurhonensis]|nr:hypothetical protein [Paenibacillus bouchesdurhonensis]
MIIFLSIVAGVSFLEAIGDGKNNKPHGQNMAAICCAAIIAIAIIKVFS